MLFFSAYPYSQIRKIGMPLPRLQGAAIRRFHDTPNILDGNEANDTQQDHDAPEKQLIEIGHDKYLLSARVQYNFLFIVYHSDARMENILHLRAADRRKA
jgi:hypothetical protein